MAAAEVVDQKGTEAVAKAVMQREPTSLPRLDPWAVYGPEDVARLLRLNRKDVDRLVSSGALPVRKVGTSWRALGLTILRALEEPAVASLLLDVALLLAELRGPARMTDFLRLGRGIVSQRRSPEEAAADAVKAVRAVRRAQRRGQPH